MYVIPSIPNAGKTPTVQTANKETNRGTERYSMLRKLPEIQ